MPCKPPSVGDRRSPAHRKALADQRSEAAQAYRRLYHTAAWLRLRRVQLAAYPLCKRCAQLGETVAASVVHHVQAHKGDWSAFVNGELESLCRACHDSSAQSEERKGHGIGCDAQGLPLDSQHFWHE